MMATRDAQLGNANAGNPFAGGGGGGSMMAPAGQVGYTVSLGNGESIMVNSEADFLKLKDWHSSNQRKSGAASLGGGSSGGGSSSLGSTIDLAAEGFQTVTGYLAGSNYNTKLQDYQDARSDLLDTRDQLTAHRSSATDPVLVDLMLKSVDSTLDTMDTAIGVLNTQITAVDMFAGGSAAKVVSRFVGDGGLGGGGSGFGTVAAIGAAGLGLGLVLRNNNNQTSTRRRSR